MHTRLQVTGMLHLKERGLFVVYGNVVDGVVAAGQHVVVPQGLDALVETVEPVHVGRGGGIGLTFRYVDAGQLGEWVRLPLVGAELVLGGREDAQCPYRVGDDVRYVPSQRGRAQSLHTDLERLVPGQIYRIVRLDRHAYIVLEGFESAGGGGIYWTEFSSVVG